MLSQCFHSPCVCQPVLSLLIYFSTGPMWQTGQVGWMEGGRKSGWKEGRQTRQKNGCGEVEGWMMSLAVSYFSRLSLSWTCCHLNPTAPAHQCCGLLSGKILSLSLGLSVFICSLSLFRVHPLLDCLVMLEDFIFLCGTILNHLCCREPFHCLPTDSCKP